MIISSLSTCCLLLVPDEIFTYQLLSVVNVELIILSASCNAMWDVEHIPYTENNERSRMLIIHR